jgi:hypothetical protein
VGEERRGEGGDELNMYHLKIGKKYSRIGAITLQAHSQ